MSAMTISRFDVHGCPGTPEPSVGTTDTKIMDVETAMEYLSTIRRDVTKTVPNVIEYRSTFNDRNGIPVNKIAWSWETQNGLRIVWVIFIRVGV